MEDHDGYYDNNWDLHAVVRAACRRRLSPPPGPISPFLPLPPPQQSKAEEPDLAWRFPDLARGADELYVAFLASSAPTPQPPPATPPDGPHQTAARTQQRGQPSGRPASGAAPRSKRRKSQQKKVVCHVPADGVSADVWAWRKYGQKPIKGSPYPRGYYRCSSSKACVARKQVERSRDNPNTFVITYTGEHSHPAPTHRNSLAGTTRHKFPTASAPPPEAQASPPSTSAGLSPTTPLREPSMDGEAEDEEDDDDDEGMLLVEDMEMVAEDELLFLAPDAAFDGGSGGTGCNGAAAMAALFDADGPDEPFFVSPWVGTTGTTAARGPS